MNCQREEVKEEETSTENQPAAAIPNTHMYMHKSVILRTKVHLSKAGIAGKKIHRSIIERECLGGE